MSDSSLLVFSASSDVADGRKKGLSTFRPTSRAHWDPLQLKGFVEQLKLSDYATPVKSNEHSYFCMFSSAAYHGEKHAVAT